MKTVAFISANLALGVMCSELRGQTKPVQTLRFSQYLQTVFANDAQIKSINQQQAAASAETDYQDYNYKPQYSLEGSTGLTGNLFPTSGGYLHNFGVYATKTIYNKKYQFNKRFQERIEKEFPAQVLVRKASLTILLVNLFLDFQREKETLKLIDKHRKIIEDFKQDAIIKTRQREVTKTSIAQAQSRLLRNRTLFLQARQNISEFKTSLLSYNVGSIPTALYLPKLPNLAKDPNQGINKKALRNLFAKRADYQLQQRRIETATAAIENKQNEFSPDLQVRSSVKHIVPRTVSTTWTVELLFNMPLFNRQQTRKFSTGAQLQRKAQVHLLEDIVTQNIEAFRQAQNQLRFNKQLMKNLEKASENSEKTLVMVLKEYRSGTVGDTSVLQIQDELFSFESATVDAIYNLKKIEVQLLALSGQLTLDRIKAAEGIIDYD